MTMYYCKGCDRLIDNDRDPMNEDECCGDCHNEYVDETLTGANPEGDLPAIKPIRFDPDTGRVL